MGCIRSRRHRELSCPFPCRNCSIHHEPNATGSVVASGSVATCFGQFPRSSEPYIPERAADHSNLFPDSPQISSTPRPQPEARDQTIFLNFYEVKSRLLPNGFGVVAAAGPDNRGGKRRDGDLDGRTFWYRGSLSVWIDNLSGNRGGNTQSSPSAQGDSDQLTIRTIFIEQPRLHLTARTIPRNT